MQNIVFVPGLNCTGDLFAPQVAALSRIAQCHIADHSGFDSLEAVAGDILSKAPQRFALSGLSMGGYVAFEIVRQAPDRVTGLALLDTRSAKDTAEDAERRRQTIRLAQSGQFDRLHDILWPRLVHPARQSDSRLEEIVKGMMRDTGPERFVRQQTAVLNRGEYQPTLESVAVPTIVVTGAQDSITPPETGRALAAFISGARYIEIPDCGHLSTLERPDEVNRTLVDWLKITST
jgi:pimeloyl-ACP methyl ester carboxylesterase